MLLFLVQLVLFNLTKEVNSNFKLEKLLILLHHGHQLLDAMQMEEIMFHKMKMHAIITIKRDIIMMVPLDHKTGLTFKLIKNGHL